MEAHFCLENEQSPKIGEVEAHFFFESGPGPRPGSGGSGDAKIAHALRASHSGGFPWVEQTRHVVIFLMLFNSKRSTA